jgi:hypothetical protein
MLVMGLIMIIPIISADTWFDQNSSLSLTANLFIEDYTDFLITNQSDPKYNTSKLALK